MRKDAIGLFWQDFAKEKPPKVEKEKRQPPPRTWEDPSYLPGLAEAMAFNIPMFTRETLVLAAVRGDELLMDCEVYPNYFQCAFMSYHTGEVIDFIATPDHPLNVVGLRWALETFCTVGFNTIAFDNVILGVALAGGTCAQLYEATVQLIQENKNRADVLKAYKAKKLKLNCIDLIEVAPLSASLKIYGGRLHVPRMQDLPFPPGTWLSPAQMAIVRYYCVNDLRTTAYLRHCLTEQIKLRIAMSAEYGIDLRSKSDAQIAEAVIGDEVGAINHMRPQKPTIEVGTEYRYRVPAFLRYETPMMASVLNWVANTPFVVGDSGAVGMPPNLADMKITIGAGVYRMGIGGLHSSEQTAAHYADDDTVLVDRDVISYYPKIIINQGLFPAHLGPAFLTVYSSLVDRRITAKAEGRKVVANSLKIVVNGSFGKLGSKYSILYAPDLLIQTTITGQLALLMLIERLENRGIPVVSANTDGIVIKCPKPLMGVMEAVVAQWERETNFETEETRYLALYSRDVNNYIAVKAAYDKVAKLWTSKPDGTKNKGAFANPWLSAKDPAEVLHKNPANQICIEAVEAFLVRGVAVSETIRKCTDIKKFVSVRNVTGGAVQKGEYLGKSVRWYYCTEDLGEMVYARSGNKVPRSDGARPALQLPVVLPTDIDYEWYEREALSVLSDVGYRSLNLEATA